MDELTEVRELRADAPRADRARLAAGRARLLDAARAGERRRALWRRRELVIVAVVAAVTAVAVTAALLVGGDGAGHKVRPATGPTLDLRGMSAAGLLNRAADTLETEADGPVPTAGQWIYRRAIQENQDQTLPDSMVPQAYIDESWIRYDGTALASMEFDGKSTRMHTIKMHLENGGEGDDRSAREMYRVLAALPAGGEQTLQVLREKNAIEDDKGVSRAENDYTEISVLLDAYVMPSKGLASLYRALATLPGGKVTDHLVETKAGTRAIALSYDRGDDPRTGEPTQDQWLIDPQTYRIIGQRLLTDGKITGGSSLSEMAVVDRAGVRGPADTGPERD
ncbi:CU044_5270 family protein [Streptomyces griseorubiginosus]|uniref:CU044_5270 family protein n=1 Tax=Streptomyces griseorubiginosus TaxID=67304 RepID=UPI0033A69BCA